MKYGDYEQGFFRCWRQMIWFKPHRSEPSRLIDNCGYKVHIGIGVSDVFDNDTPITPLDAAFSERVTRLVDAEVVPGMLVDVLDGMYKEMRGMVFSGQDDDIKGIQFTDQFTRSNCAVRISDVKSGGA